MRKAIELTWDFYKELGWVFMTGYFASQIILAIFQ